ncbi:MAG TPA: ABC-ATPase UvrA, partial [Pirellulaceae bacterium]|nr:ABC-ATPase UvrA [Pirellulaceae bacterium]
MRQQTVAEIVENVMSLPTGAKFMILAPFVRGRKGHHRDVLEQIRRERLVRVRVNGDVHDIDHCPDLNSRQPHDIEAVTDRLVMRPGIEARLREAIELAVRMTGRLVTVCLIDADTVASMDTWPVEKVFSTQLACPQCDVSYPEIEPRSFSFNSPYGMCPDCQGMGVVAEGAVCLACQGSRIGPSGRAVYLEGATVLELSQMSVTAALEWSAVLESSTHIKKQLVARPILELRARLEFLDRVGLGYLTLGRGIDTLSGGEFQRVRLASALGAGLTNTCIVLDEPSIGLHPRDTQRLIEIMRELRDVGNTLLVVEHDESIMRHADWLVDLGPGAGIHGGRVMAVGKPDDVARLGNGATALFLRGQKPIQRRSLPRSHLPDQWLELIGVSGNNLKDVTLRMPLGTLCAVTGVSGSGKSTLINQTLVPALQKHMGMSPNALAAPFRELRGGDSIRRVVMIDQSPIGRSGRSCPATYCGVFDSLRRIFAATKAARRLGFSPSRFSFNSRQGACAVCRGNGQILVRMKFLPDWFINCESCQGRRFNAQTLEVRFRGMTIADVLELTMEQAAAEFAGFSKIHRVLKTLEETGLGYLRLGQPSTTLSGGEAQRMKLANELALPEQGQSLYVLDEPTTGLHPADVQNILEVMDRLVASGNTVVVIEHHLDVIRNADWVIDLGPEG